MVSPRIELLDEAIFTMKSIWVDGDLDMVSVTNPITCSAEEGRAFDFNPARRGRFRMARFTDVGRPVVCLTDEIL